MVMLRFVIVIVALASIASQCFADESFPLKARRVLFLGDSITNAGYFVADIETQLLLQRKTSPPEIINLGLPSETCSGLTEPDHPFPRPDVHERLDRALEKVKPDVVVACYGMNDGIYYPFDEKRFAAYKSGIKKLIEKTHAAGAKIVLLTPPPFDPVPLDGKEGKLLPQGAEKYAWFAIYENYNQEVIRRYAEWILTQNDDADMIVDVYVPMTEFLARKRMDDPNFYVASDGVHMDEVGHEILAKAILSAWGVDIWIEAPKELRKTVKQKEAVLHDAWLSHVGHKRPGVKPGLPIDQAQQKASEFATQITAQLVR